MSSSNTDSNDKNNPIESGGSTNNSNNVDMDTNYNISTPERWILVLGIVILVLGVILLTLRSVLFSLILIIIGISLFTYWLYVNARSRELSRNHITYIGSAANDDDTTATTMGKQEGICICSICEHKESGICLHHKCACCILMRNNKIIGHSNNPLQ